MENVTEKQALEIMKKHHADHSACGPLCHAEISVATAVLIKHGYAPHESVMAGQLVQQSASAD